MRLLAALGEEKPPVEAPGAEKAPSSGRKRGAEEASGRSRSEALAERRAKGTGLVRIAAVAAVLRDRREGRDQVIVLGQVADPEHQLELVGLALDPEARIDRVLPIGRQV